MIYYFSGTGNSLYAAAKIAEAQGDKLVSIAKELDLKKETYEITCKDGDSIGFVYPVYAWGPPKIVLQFISRLSVTGSKPYVFSVSTCGGSEGNTSGILKKALVKKGLSLGAAFSLKMPGNYIIGFDVDSKEEVEALLGKADEKLAEINTVIADRRNAWDTIPGSRAGIRSALANPLFNAFALGTKPFYATDACTSCKICETVCPVHSITVNGKPAWKKECTQCLACINSCPVHAIQYGKNTAARGRYLHPDIKKLREL